MEEQSQGLREAEGAVGLLTDNYAERYSDSKGLWKRLVGDILIFGSLMNIFQT